jgi:hypothetical protein
MQPTETRRFSDINHSHKQGQGQGVQDEPGTQVAPSQPDDLEFIDDEELGGIGNLGNEEDEALDLDTLLESLDRRHPTRFSYVVQRAAECLRTLKEMRGAQPSPWLQDRVPEEHWRALADEALGLIGNAVKQEMEHQELVASLPEDERKDLQGLLDSSLGMKIFRKAFTQERSAWEKAFWLMALDQSFGKRPWTGPQGWRDLMKPRYPRQGKVPQ